MATRCYLLETVCFRSLLFSSFFPLAISVKWTRYLALYSFSCTKCSRISRNSWCYFWVFSLHSRWAWETFTRTITAYCSRLDRRRITLTVTKRQLAIDSTSKFTVLWLDINRIANAQIIYNCADYKAIMKLNVYDTTYSAKTTVQIVEPNCMSKCMVTPIRATLCVATIFMPLIACRCYTLQWLI